MELLGVALAVGVFAGALAALAWWGMRQADADEAEIDRHWSSLGGPE